MKTAKIEAFKDQIDSGKMQTNKIKIYNLIKQEPSTIAKLREVTGMPHQTLTGALSSLEDMGWIYRTDEVKVKNRTYTLYAAETNIERAKRNALIVESQKFLDWMHRGEKNGWFDQYDAHLELRFQLFQKAIENEQTN